MMKWNKTADVFEQEKRTGFFLCVFMCFWIETICFGYAFPHLLDFKEHLI